MKIYQFFIQLSKYIKFIYFFHLNTSIVFSHIDRKNIINGWYNIYNCIQLNILNICMLRIEYLILCHKFNNFSSRKYRQTEFLKPVSTYIKVRLILKSPQFANH